MSNQNTDQWQLAIDENQNYIKLGKAMQQRGTVILNSIPITDKNVIDLGTGTDVVGTLQRYADHTGETPQLMED